MVHETGNGAEQFNCPASPNDVNKQLLADCSAGECSTLPPCYPVTRPAYSPPPPLLRTPRPRI